LLLRETPQLTSPRKHKKGLIYRQLPAILAGKAGSCKQNRQANFVNNPVDEVARFW
jgi:hypothetical protein